MQDEEKAPKRNSALSVNLALNKNSKIVPYFEKLDLNLVVTNKSFQKMFNISINSAIFQCKPESYSKLYNPVKFTPDNNHVSNSIKLCI